MTKLSKDYMHHMRRSIRDGGGEEYSHAELLGLCRHLMRDLYYYRHVIIAANDAYPFRDIAMHHAARYAYERLLKLAKKSAVQPSPGKKPRRRSCPVGDMT